MRETLYSEILDIIAAYESGLSQEIKQVATEKNRALTIEEVEQIIARFEKHALWKPLIHSGRTKMASRDMALREAFHYRLIEYIEPLKPEEYQRFLGETAEEVEKLMQENKLILKRLKERS